MIGKYEGTHLNSCVEKNKAGFIDFWVSSLVPDNRYKCNECKQIFYMEMIEE